MDAAQLLAPVQVERTEWRARDDDEAPRHELPDILTIALCAIVGGAETWNDVELYGQAKLPWLRTFLSLPHDIPTRLVFERVFDRIDPVACDALVLPWAQSLIRRSTGELFASNNTAMRRSPRRAALLSATDGVSIWATEQRLIFGQLASTGSSNEDTAVPALLTLLNIDDAIVAIDAQSCQSVTAKAIYQLGEQFVITLPKSSSTARTIVEQFVAEAHRNHWRGIPHQHLAAVERSDGKSEKVHYWITPDPALLAALNPDGTTWPGLATVGIVERECADAAGSYQEISAYLSSLDGETPAFVQAIRGCRGVRSRTHWALDIALRADVLWARIAFADENFAVLRRIAHDLLRQDASTTAGSRTRRLRAGWDDGHMLRLLAGGPGYDDCSGAAM